MFLRSRGISNTSIEEVFKRSPLILTEGAVGQRIEREYGFKPNKDIMYSALIYNEGSRNALAAIYRQYLRIAEEYKLPILLMTNTRRANKERVMRSGYNDKNVLYDYSVFLRNIANAFDCEAFIGGMMGCKGDAYSGKEGISFEEALAFHAWQANMFREAPIDFMFAALMPSIEETMGMAKVLEQTKKPYIMSLMICRDGTLLDGTTIHNAIQKIDDVVVNKPLCFMTNCVHPKILSEALSQPFNNTDLVKERFCGIQANAACFDPEVLDNSVDLQTTSAPLLIDDLESLHNKFPLKVMGGCCGTNHTHIEEIARRFKR